MNFVVQYLRIFLKSASGQQALNKSSNMEFPSIKGKKLQCELFQNKLLWELMSAPVIWMLHKNPIKQSRAPQATICSPRETVIEPLQSQQNDLYAQWWQISLRICPVW